MNASMSFRKNLSPITIATSSMRCLHHWFTGTSQRSIAPLKPRLKHFYWILISLNIFICLAYCDDDVITPSSQPYPQKRGGGKYSLFLTLSISEIYAIYSYNGCVFFFPLWWIDFILIGNIEYLHVQEQPVAVIIMVYSMSKTIVIKPLKSTRTFHHPSSRISIEIDRYCVHTGFEAFVVHHVTGCFAFDSTDSKLETF